MINNNDAKKEHFEFSRLPLRRDRAYQKAQKNLKKEEAKQANCQTIEERAEKSAEGGRFWDLVDAARASHQKKYLVSSV